MLQQPHPCATPSLLSAACPALMHLTWPLVLFALQISMQAHICHIQVSRGSVMQRGNADLVLASLPDSPLVAFLAFSGADGCV